MEDNKNKLKDPRLEKFNSLVDQRFGEYNPPTIEQKPKEETSTVGGFANDFMDSFKTVANVVTALNPFTSLPYQITHPDYVKNVVLPVLGQPGEQFNESVKQMSDNPIAGLVGVGLSLGSLFSTPLAMVDRTLRYHGLESVANTINAPFEFVAEGVSGLTNVIDQVLPGTREQKNEGVRQALIALGMDVDTAYKLNDERLNEIADKLNQANQFIAQYLAAGVLHKGAGVIKNQFKKPVELSTAPPIEGEYIEPPYRLSDYGEQTALVPTKKAVVEQPIDPKLIEIEQGRLKLERTNLEEKKAELKKKADEYKTLKTKEAKNKLKQIKNSTAIIDSRLKDLEQQIKPTKLNIDESLRQEFKDNYEYAGFEKNKLGLYKVPGTKSYLSEDLAILEYQKIKEKSITKQTKEQPKKGTTLQKNKIQEVKPETNLQPAPLDKGMTPSEVPQRVSLTEQPQPTVVKPEVKDVNQNLEANRLSIEQGKSSTEPITMQRNVGTDLPKTETVTGLTKTEVTADFDSNYGSVGIKKTKSGTYIIPGRKGFFKKEVAVEEYNKLKSTTSSGEETPSIKTEVTADFDSDYGSVGIKKTKSGTYIIPGRKGFFKKEAAVEEYNKLKSAEETSLNTTKEETPVKAKDQTIGNEPIAEPELPLRQTETNVLNEPITQPQTKVETANVQGGGTGKNVVETTSGGKETKPIKTIDDEINLAKEELKQANIDQFKNLKSSLPISPEVMAKLTKLGSLYIKKGVVNFAEFSAKMIEDVGEWVRPHLLAIWNNSKKEYEQKKAIKAKTEIAMKNVEGKLAEKDGVGELNDELSNKERGKGRRFVDFNIKRSIVAVEGFGKAGKEFADRIRLMEDREREHIGLPSRIAYDMGKLNKLEYKLLEKVTIAKMFGKELPKNLPKRVADIVKETDKYLSDVIVRARNAGFTVKELPNYRKRALKYSLDEFKQRVRFDGRDIFNEKREKILTKMVKDGKARNKAEASFILDNYIAENTVRKSGSLEHSRTIALPEEYYITDPVGNIVATAIDVEKRIAFAERFGIKGEIAKDILNDIREESGVTAELFARKLYQHETGQLTATDRRILEVINNIKSYQTLTKFTFFTTLRNSFQSVLGSSTRGNLPSAVLGFIKSFSETAKRNAYESGALADQIERVIIGEMTGDNTLTGKYLEGIGFTSTDVFNRIVSSTSGEVFYKSMLRRLKNDSILKGRAIREFNNIGLNAKEIIKRGEFTTEELNLIRRTFAGDAQFNIRPSDLPLSWSHPIGKLIFQWKPFGYRMGILIKDFILKEARHGNFAPIITMLAVYGIAGEAVNTIIDYIRGLVQGDFAGEEAGKKSLFFGGFSNEKDPVAIRVLNDLAGLGAMSFAVDMIRSFGYGKTGVTGALLGPTVGEVTTIASDLFTPTGELLSKGTTKDYLRNTSKGIVNAVERNTPGGGLPRTFGLTKELNDLLYPPKSKRKNVNIFK